MSVISGGIFSKPRGKTGGIVFGAARTRTGKLATARELVIPSNPNTALQQVQRSKFKSALDLIKRFGISIYQVAWNRSVGQLAGFQSMMSIILGQMDSSKDITLVNDVNLGTLHFPDTFTISSPGAGEIEIVNSDDLGSNGTNDDILFLLAFAKTDADRQLVNGVEVVNDSTRVESGTSITGLITGATYEIYSYMQGVGTASGLYSVAKVGSQLVA